jgi:transposase
MVRMTLVGETRKVLLQRLQQAYAAHTTRLVRRIHALLALADGKTLDEVAETLGVGEQTIRDWFHAFIAQGVDSLFYRPRAGRPAKLTRSQRQELKELVLAGPEAAGYSSGCWTSGMIADLIQLRFRVEYAPRYVCHLLGLLGLSFQRGRFTSDHLNDEAVLLWLEETWPAILRQAKEKPAVILFGDEASFAQWGTIGYTWALKGVQPTVKTSGIRKAYRVFGLLDCFGGTLYQQGLEGKKFNSDTYAHFLTWVLTQTSDHLIVIQDNAKYHVSAAMQTFYAKHTDRLTVYQLPPYSPELNPIEGLWKKVKKEATHLKWFPKFSDLVTEVKTTLTKLAALPAELTALQGDYRHLLLPAEVAHD